MLYLKRCMALIAMIFVSPLFAADEQLGEGMVNPGYVDRPAWFKQSFLDIREDVAEASSESKRVMLYFYQDGCPYCERLVRVNFAQHEIVEKTRSGFEAIAINLWGDREVTGLKGEVTTEKQFAKSLRVQFTPTLLFLDEQGKVALRVNGFYPPHKMVAALDYVAGKHESAGSFRDYYARLAPKPASGKLHREPGYLQPTLDLRRKAGAKPLLVFFEQKQCATCDELHGDTLKRKPLQQAMAYFDVALVDIWSNDPLITPDGKRTTARNWAKQMNVQFTPSLLFFDSTGSETFRTEAYLRAFHVESAMLYVSSGAYNSEPEFQRFVQGRADQLHEQGIEVDLWK
ncbi:thioredoxin [Solemya pervernicosa gill symbiont]|uniref:Thioredoxin n=1 Tax=Solemya pervernicosa gill symbiont TaxID=642797 RepID=A0A1T2L0J1_9GAMM|nr:thioredoxin fold domain-containing protein [Solemya pervernicosa gill symbiont]OOZ38592.1 thioredoxin [Solemya pervernicosa gill symbiont]